MAYIPSPAERMGARIKRSIPDITSPAATGLVMGGADTVAGLWNGESLPEAASSALGTAGGAYLGSRLGAAAGGRLGNMAGGSGAYRGSFIGDTAGMIGGSVLGGIAGDEAIALLNQHLGY